MKVEEKSVFTQGEKVPPEYFARERKHIELDAIGKPYHIKLGALGNGCDETDLMVEADETV